MRLPASFNTGNGSVSTIGWNYYLFCSIILLSLAAGTFVNAQSKFAVTGGWGYYERANVGAQWTFSERSSLSLYGGTNIGFKDHTAWTAGLSFDRIFHKTLFSKLQPGYSLGIMSWTNDDDLYFFRTFSLPLMSLLAYPLTTSVTTRLEGGVILNKVNETVRKQNVEAGFPKRVNGNIRFSIIYKIGKK